MSPSTSENDWRAMIGSLHTWQRGDERAVHKPLLVLLLMARAERHEDRRVRFVDVDERLAQLLKEFGPPRKSYHPEFPFWHLQHDGFWEVENSKAFEMRKGGHSPTRTTLLKHDAIGNVEASLWNAVEHNESLRYELVEMLLNSFWPQSYHDAIKQAVGLQGALELATEKVTRKVRDPAFRENVLRAYERRCAVCGYDGRLGNELLGMEAAHVKWHCNGGPDNVANGLALCAFHHVALDRGAYGLTDDRRVVVSADVNGTAVVPEILHRFEGQPVRDPQRGFEPIAAAFIQWHRREVFRGPARATGRRMHLQSTAQVLSRRSGNSLR